MYNLLADGDGTLFLQVLTGGIGMDVLTFQLTENESASFRSLGKDYLDDLAAEVCKNPEKFLGRS